MQLQGEHLKEFQSLVEQYNQCFYDKNVVALRQMYVADGNVRFFDNHPDHDSSALKDHLDEVAVFFQAAGDIQELIIEDLTAYQVGDGACVVLMLRYSGQPRPGVRTTMFLEKEAGTWKIRHMHHSFDPSETAQTREMS